jgi:3'(2'), 5'-bisphosphate nucleotidase
MEVSQLTEFSDQVIKAVELASIEVMDIYNSERFIVEDKSDGSPVTIADKKSHEVLFSYLTSIDSSIPILSEEGDRQDSNLEKFWLIDPLDGTKEFINKNGEFTVNVALIEEGKPILGVVSAPAINETFLGFAGAAYKIVNEDKISISAQKQSEEHCLSNSK